MPPLLEIAAPKPIPITTWRLAQAYSPIPIRHHYHHDQADASDLQHGGGQQQQQPFHPGAGRGIPQPATPAPTPPPPSPKPKKQQYQTDQSRPFLFPFSRDARNRYFDKDARLVPFAVDEADRLYNRHMHVSLALAQMWRTREDCMTAESGLEHMPGSEGQFESSTFISKDPDAGEPLPDIALLDAKIAEATKAVEETDSPLEKRRAKERREDLMRLKRVEQIYASPFFLQLLQTSLT